ncbi:hypothetical protein [Belnapia sp. F-4-1]|uniref:hypothetical protein n=1 Tax=Belnapia sp. F-4-1 TaxID=1545443 RepID=UPI0011849FAC|nr:hypothetical protein [Belnapia sp. F-4-1]
MPAQGLLLSRLLARVQQAVLGRAWHLVLFPRLAAGSAAPWFGAPLAVVLALWGEAWRCRLRASG